MNKINYIIGDLFASIKDKDNPIMICHIVNDIGAWGSGFVVPLGKHFQLARNSYLRWYNDKKKNGISSNFKLGAIQIVAGNDKIYVTNMIGQTGIGFSNDGKPPIRYDALEKCMNEVKDFVLTIPNCEIHAPMFGAARAGGDWNKIEEMINNIWVKNNIPVTIYKFEEKKSTFFNDLDGLLK